MDEWTAIKTKNENDDGVNPSLCHIVISFTLFKDILVGRTRLV
jgi:hypothetical protein